MRISFDEMHRVMKEKLIKHGVCEEIADDCARNLTENSQGGIASHGLNRLPRVIAMLQEGSIKPDAKPVCVQSMGAFEKWNGGLGMGNTNAELAMNRAIALAKEYGIGCVAMAHTNHWQRGGAYGIQAAKSGCIGICWTNTMPNMPAWNANDRRIGNNPLVFCAPYGDDYVMADGAMAQFSYGAIESAKLAGRQLPVAGGFDENGNMTTDPAAIEKTWRVLPIGFWKGSSFSILMDILAASLSSGMGVCDIGKQGDKPTDEYNLSQVFIAINVANPVENDAIVQRIIEDLKKSEPAEAGGEILYPCEKERRIYRENLEKGIPVDEGVWQTVLAL